MIRPSFIAFSLPDGSSLYKCNETSERFIIGPNNERGETYSYRGNELLYTGKRAECVDAVERAAAWSLR